MKSYKIFALSAIALLGISACQQKEIAPEVTPGATHTVTFVADAPETKTTVDISDGETAKFAWTEADEGRFTLYENGTKATETVGILDGETRKMTLMATFEGPIASESASYVAVVNESNATQIMRDEAYDEEADILVSKAESSFDRENGVQLQFKREVAIAKMTLKGLDANEVVNMVTVSSTADIAGSYGVDGWVSPAKTSLEISSAFAKAGEGYSIVANEAGEAVVWFTCIPQDAATLTVNVEAADGDTYSKEFSRAITLTRGDVKAFGVAMKKGLRKEKVYSLVESTPADWTGEYILVATNSDINYALDMNKANSDWGVCSEVSIENNSLSASSAGMVVKVEKGTTDGTYSIKSSDGNYLSASAKGSFNFSDDYSSANNDFQFTFDEKTYTVKVVQLSSTASPKRNLRYNYNNGKGGFRWYDGTTGSSPKFYSYSGQKYILPSPEGISVNSETKRVSWDAVKGAASYVLTIGTEEYPCSSNFYDASDIEDEYYDVAVVAVPEDAEHYKNSAAATLTDAKFGTPKLAAPTLEKGSVDESSVNATWTVDSRATAGYNCELYNGETKVGDSKTVSTGSVTFDSLEDGVTYAVKVNAIAVEGAKAYAASDVATIDLKTTPASKVSDVTKAETYTIKNLTVYAKPNNSLAILGDATGYILFYAKNHGLSVGNTLDVAGPVVDYYGLWEFSGATASNVKPGSTPDYGEPVEATNDFLASFAEKPLIKYIHAIGVQSGQDITVGENKLRLSEENPSTDGKTVIVYGFTYGYHSTNNYVQFVATSIAEDPTVPKLSVTPTSKTWASDAIDAAVFNVKTNTEGVKDWSVSPKTLEWATIAVNNGTITVTPKGANKTDEDYEATLTVTHAAGTLSETITLRQVAAGASAKVEKTATITFGTDNVKIDKASVTAADDCENPWTITTAGTTSFTANPYYYQVGSGSKPATSITFTTTLPSDAEVSSIEAKFGGFSDTAGTVSLKVGDTSVGSGKLNAKNDVTVSSTKTAAGNVVKVSITDISKGVKCYYIKVGYKTAE